MTMRVACGHHTDVGRVRSHNEDGLIAGRRVWAVADGMGGHAAGDVASSLVIGRLHALDEADALRPTDLLTALAEASETVRQHGDEHPRSAGLGTTVTGLAAVEVDGEDRWAVFNVGDSRVYRLADGELARVTVDHSEVEELVAGGIITADQARHHPLRNIVTRSVGGAHPPAVDLWLLAPTPGERFVVCSDGLNSEVEDADIARLAAATPDPQDAAEALVAAALAAGGRDNVTVVVVDVQEPSGS
jgi:protein phosphatase